MAMFDSNRLRRASPAPPAVPLVPELHIPGRALGVVDGVFNLAPISLPHRDPRLKQRPPPRAASRSGAKLEANGRATSTVVDLCRLNLCLVREMGTFRLAWQEFHGRGVVGVITQNRRRSASAFSGAIRIILVLIKCSRIQE